jgi:hypothetical protein
MRKSLIALVFCLGACAVKVEVADVAIPAVPETAVIPGTYAAFVQDGGWELQAQSTGLDNCGGWTFDADVNATYQTAMKALLARSVAKVTFLPGPIPPEDIAAKGYDGLIVIHQANASAALNVSSGFYRTARSTVGLTTIVAIIQQKGNVFQGSRESKGSGVAQSWGCRDVAAAVKSAAQAAVQATVLATTAEIRRGLAIAQQAK